MRFAAVRPATTLVISILLALILVASVVQLYILAR